MMKLIDWLNCNDGAVMSIITFVYVIATCLICYFNFKSASSAAEQTKESVRQQKQNAGIQLYSLRKAVMVGLTQKKYNDIYWDATILFDETISSEILALGHQQNKLDVLEEDMKNYENRLEEDRPELYANFLKVRRRMDAASEKTDEEYEELYAICDQYKPIFKDSDNGDRVLDYRHLKESFFEQHALVGGQYAVLFLKIKEYIRESIS